MLGLVCAGLLSGSALLFNIRNDETAIKIRPKHSRPCNAVSFNSNGLLAIGLDKVRSDNCLQIWSIDRISQTEKEAPKTATYSFLPSDVISSLAFVPEMPSSLICGSYKFLREFDLRSQSTAIQLATKYVHGITFDPFNPSNFCSHAEDGTVSFWDRRQIRNGEPLLVLNPNVDSARAKGGFPCFRLSSTRRGEFGILQDGDAIKRWQYGFVPPHREPSYTSRVDKPPQIEMIPGQPFTMKPKYMFVSSVTQSSTLLDRVVSFDYVFDIDSPLSVNFICIKQSGQVFRMRVTESPTAVKFDPFNEVATVDPENITFLSPKIEAPAKRRDSEYSIATVDTEVDQDNFDLNMLTDPATLLAHDISTTIRQLALKGYSMDAEKNLEVLSSVTWHPRADSLKFTWRWLQLAGRSASKGALKSGNLDLSYQGVWGIWNCYNHFFDDRHRPSSFVKSDYLSNLTQIFEGSKRNIFTAYESPSIIKQNLRIICLRVAGWNFEIDQLEEKLRELEDEGEFEKAAGWAVFHNDIPRAVRALSNSNNEQLIMMATAIAGYLTNGSVDGNNTWKDLCRKMASELESPYMQAIFSYIADQEWLDVLDTSPLPLHERLGIALRFFDDDKLTRYLRHLVEKVIRSGDLDGIILTGVTPHAVQLLQTYVDKTCDVQTASLIISYGTPKYFEEETTSHWIDCYRNLLNSWRLFSQRARFDVARSKYSKDLSGTITCKVPPRQIYLQCNSCKAKVELGTQLPAQDTYNGRYSNQIRVQGSELNIRCPRCSHPLPRCAICLLPLGSPLPNLNLGFLSKTSLSDNSKSSEARTSAENGAMTSFKLDSESPVKPEPLNRDKWFTFCLSCNHGVHARHPQDWFAKHDVCPVPDCDCYCNRVS